MRAALTLTPLPTNKIAGMPTYEYICEKCGHQFEKVQPISAEPLSICPEEDCGQKRWGKGKVKRAISAGAGLIFKGSGFYITDYRSEKYKEAAKKDSAPASSGKSESKGSGGDSKATASKPASGKPAAAKH
jgi:putative FmdB family regulatory protein